MKLQKIPPETALALYRTMLLIRCFEERVIELYPRQEMRTPVHLCIGQEAVAAGVCAHLRPADAIFSTHRNHGHCLAKGMEVKKLLAEFFGRRTGCCGGKGGSMHPADPGVGIPGTTAIVGGGIPLAAGTAWASMMQGRPDVSVAFFGDGATEEGTFHETLNFAALKKLPVIFVCENNSYATASPIGNRQPGAVTIADRAKAYGMRGIRVDGNDSLAIYRVAGRAVDQARQGKGPTLIEAVTYRWMAHVGPVDDTETGHRPAAELAEWRRKCPLEKLRRHLVSQGIMNGESEKRFLAAVHKELDEAVAFAGKSALPDKDDLLKHVFAAR